MGPSNPAATQQLSNRTGGGIVTFLRNHVVLMFLYALGAGLFFSFLWKHERKERIRLFVVVFCALFVGAIVLGWLMLRFAPHR